MERLIYAIVGKSRGNKQLDKNAAKEKSTDSKKSKKMVKVRNLGGGQSRVKVKANCSYTDKIWSALGRNLRIYQLLAGFQNLSSPIYSPYYSFTN
jgi:hypothetical protein